MTSEIKKIAMYLERESNGRTNLLKEQKKYEDLAKDQLDAILFVDMFNELKRQTKKISTLQNNSNAVFYFEENPNILKTLWGEKSGKNY